VVWPVTDTPSVAVDTATAPDGTVTVTVRGEVDIANVEALRRHLAGVIDSPPPRVVFDLGELSFVDSSGIAVLVQVANAAPEVKVGAASPVVRRILEVTGLGEHFGLDQT
jgi:anti-sigma B factor antagonist